MTTSASSAKRLLVYTGRVPNGFKVSTFLEELKLAYGGPDYETYPIDISTNKQKEPWFIQLNPNGRIPALTDRGRNNFTVFESAAILLYLVKYFDSEQRFTFDQEKEADDYSEMLQWIFFAHGGVGPMQGQARHFTLGTKEDIPYARRRYVDETKRLYSVLEIRLKDRDYLAGRGRGKVSIADFNVFPWVRRHSPTIAPTLDEWPGLKAWAERLAARPGVQAGLNVPPEAKK
ncbi:glutathione S-transferase-like protein [Auriscalpium vulgare]|uniref:Glutathione S-transferase-like protein n=1 Tax=Auriscalpium vulgare TaxID=40419 RepID=A0ACB8RRZ5_9AGAM|nr:glutathione S-transferase-like protein [Auriscalpium vulgare]